MTKLHFELSKVILFGNFVTQAKIFPYFIKSVFLSFL